MEIGETPFDASTKGGELQGRIHFMFPKSYNAQETFLWPSNTLGREIEEYQPSIDQLPHGKNHNLKSLITRHANPSINKNVQHVNIGYIICLIHMHIYIYIYIYMCVCI